MKKYLNKNVYDATQERLDYIFSEFDNIYISFSGGKDSGVLLNLAIDYMKKHNITEKIGVLIIDLEAQYKATIDYIEETIKEHSQYINIYWVCLPLNLRNSVSNINPYWCCWDKNKKWIRELPENAITIDNHNFSFYKERMEFEEFILPFGKWYSKGKKVACLVGIRSDESLNRFRTIANRNKTMYRSKIYSTYVQDNTYNFYPIYDWKTKDIWVYNGKYSKKYNTLYDKFFQAGVTLDKMRICQPYGDDQRIGLNLYKIIEPITWQKLLLRVNGANAGSIFCGTKALGYNIIELPKNHTWKTYTRFLLDTLPNELKGHYIKKFKTFIRYWYKNGSALNYEIYEKLKKQGYKVNYNEICTKGYINKPFVKFKNIPDDTQEFIGIKLLNWKRMATCIIKNDIMCKGLSFSQTKDSIFKQINKIATLEKWK